MTQINDPVLWKHLLPILKADGHKYDRGVAVIYGSPSMTGATRLAAEACARIGAGLVKVIAPQGTGAIYRAALPAHIVVEDEEFRAYTPLLDKASTYQSSHHHFMDDKCRAVLMGAGTPPDKIDTRLFYRAMDADHINGIVLDAGAFMAWSGDMMLDLQAFSWPDKVAVTPHQGEFCRFFDSYEVGRKVLEADSNEELALRASKQIHCTVVLKGAETVVADFEHAVTHNRPMPNLATAGTGDVLAGMITGLLAQGMPMAAACAAAVWIHSEAASKFGKGLVASDLPDLIPLVMQNLE